MTGRTERPRETFSWWPSAATLIVAVLLAGAASTTVSPSAEAQIQPVYDVTAYGATGDGLTDDTAAIYATFHAAPLGAEVFFPPGIYMMDPTSPDNRVIKSGMTVRGVSGASVLKLRSGALDGGNFGQNDILLRNANPGTGDENIRVVGLTIDGNARGNPGPLVAEGFPLHFARVHGLWIEDTTIMDTKAGALAIQLCQDVVVRSSRVFRTGQGYCSKTPDRPCAGSADCPVSETCVKPNGDAIQVSGSANIVIEGNDIENSGEGIFCQHMHVPATTNSNCVIRDNVIRSYGANERCVASGVPDGCCTGDHAGTGGFGAAGSSFCAPGQSQGPAIGMLSAGGTIADNIIDHHWLIHVEALVGQGNLPTSSVVVSGNQLTSVDVGSGNGAIAVTTDGPGVSNVHVTGNRVQGTDDSGVLLRIFGASATISDVEVSGNTITSSCRVEQSCGSIFLDRIAATSNFTNIVIDGNNLTDGRRYGFWLEGNTVDVRARNNVVGSHTAGPFNFASPASFAEYSWNSPVTIAQLGLLGSSGVGDGSIQPCSDCRTTDPCRRGGKGAVAGRVSGIWKCRSPSSLRLNSRSRLILARRR